MDRWKKYFELAANAAIVCTCILIAYVAITRFALPNDATRNNQSLIAGTKLSVANVDWSHHEQNLVLVLSTQCHFCSESAPFYQELVSAAHRKQTPVVAILPQTTAESRLFLEHLGLDIPDVRQMPLSSIGVGGTPTVLVIDGKGTVLKVWVGKLPANDQADVLAQLQ